MRPLWEVADFVRSMRRQMRFGEFSRSPLRLLRVELREDTAECDWILRPPDIWDDSLRGQRETTTNRCRHWLTRSLCETCFLTRCPVWKAPCCGRSPSRT